ncbi:MAG: PEP-CTERM sorting domain-containing protein [Pseudomonadota bacterium]
MINRNNAALACVLGLFSLAGAAQAANVDIVIDGGFEQAGIDGVPVDPPGAVPPGWVGFTNGAPMEISIGTTTDNVFDGAYSLAVNNNRDSGGSGVIKAGNLGIGLVQPNSEVTVSFWARGSAGVGSFTEAVLFSELDGGGVSFTDNFGQLALTDDWQFFEFTGMTGGDVGGGISLQFASITGAVPGAFAELYLDNVMITVAAVPVPAAVWLFGTALGLLGLRRRRLAA